MAESCGGWPWELAGEEPTAVNRSRWFWRWRLLRRAQMAANAPPKRQGKG